MLGIELCPCIQTLGHLNRALHWPALAHLKDNEEVLLADDAQTYAFLEELIAAAAAPYRSKRIHIGMDEAHGIGLGAHLAPPRLRGPPHHHPPASFPCAGDHTPPRPFGHDVERYVFPARFPHRRLL